MGWDGSGLGWTGHTAEDEEGRKRPALEGHFEGIGVVGEEKVTGGEVYPKSGRQGFQGFPRGDKPLG